MPTGPERQALTQRLLIALVQVLGLSVWFSASAVVPTLRHEWRLSASGAVWLTASVQLGFVAGGLISTATNLPDRVRPQRLMGLGAIGAAACTAAFAGLVHGLGPAILLRAVTGVLLAAVYPVGMKLTASWSEPTRRARAFGVMIGALTLGSGLPHLIRGLGDLSWRGVMAAAAACGLAGGLIALTLVTQGPTLTAGVAAPYPRYALHMFRERRPRLVNLGYFGHMWELYAVWTWLPTFLLAAAAARHASSGAVNLTAFAAIGVAGVTGCLIGGWAADRFGRAAAAGTAMVISGLCCLASPLAFGAPAGWLLAFVLIWGAAVIADSGVFSTALSEVADRRYVGTALAAQTAIGFGLTVVTIQLVAVLAGLVGWRWAFFVLGFGPLAGAAAMRAFGRAGSGRAEAVSPR